MIDTALPPRVAGSSTPASHVLVTTSSTVSGDRRQQRSPASGGGEDVGGSVGGVGLRRERAVHGRIDREGMGDRQPDRWSSRWSTWMTSTSMTTLSTTSTTTTQRGDDDSSVGSDAAGPTSTADSSGAGWNTPSSAVIGDGAVTATPRTQNGEQDQPTRRRARRAMSGACPARRRSVRVTSAGMTPRHSENAPILGGWLRGWRHVTRRLARRSPSSARWRSPRRLCRLPRGRTRQHAFRGSPPPTTPSRRRRPPATTTSPATTAGRRCAVADAGHASADAAADDAIDAGADGSPDQTRSPPTQATQPPTAPPTTRPAGPTSTLVVTPGTPPTAPPTGSAPTPAT